MRLTKTSLVILVAISLMALSDHFVSSWQSHVWPLLAATWLFLLFCERILLWFQKIELERHLDHNFYSGRPASIIYSMINHDKYPVRVLSEEMLPQCIKTQQKTLAWDLCAHEHMQQTTTILPLSPAIVSFNNIRLTLLGRLALAWWPRNIVISHTVNVIPDYRSATKTLEPNQHGFLTASKLRAYQSVTLVLNAGYLNQLISRDLRRIDHYINTCSRLAYSALATHRSVNIIIYTNKIELGMRDIKTLPQLGELFSRLQNELKTDDAAIHRCVLPQLDTIHQPGLLLWFTDLDDSESNIELARILTHTKQRFEIQLYNLLASEIAILDADMGRRHCSPYHKLEMLTLQQRWHDSRQLLQRAGIPVIAA